MTCEKAKCKRLGGKELKSTTAATAAATTTATIVTVVL